LLFSLLLSILYRNRYVYPKVYNMFTNVNHRWWYNEYARSLSLWKTV